MMEIQDIPQFNPYDRLNSLRHLGHLLSNDEIFEALCWAGNKHRWNVFLNATDSIEPNAMAEAFKFAFGSGKPTKQTALRVLRKYSLNLISTDEERELFESLPDEVTVYRGCFLNEQNRKQGFNLSWTLSREVAEFFAHRFNQAGRGVFEATISKSRILGLFLDREEAEVLIDIKGHEGNLIDRLNIQSCCR